MKRDRRDPDAKLERDQGRKRRRELLDGIAVARRHFRRDFGAEHVQEIASFVAGWLIAKGWPEQTNSTTVIQLALVGEME